MISRIKIKKPIVNSLSTAAICYGGIGVLAPQLARQFESHLSEIIAASREILRVVLQNKIAMVKPASLRGQKRLSNTLHRLFKIESGFIELSGTEVLAIGRYLKEDLTMEISPKGTYLIPVAEAERILIKLNDDLSRC